MIRSDPRSSRQRLTASAARRMHPVRFLAKDRVVLTAVLPVKRCYGRQPPWCRGSNVAFTEVRGCRSSLIGQTLDCYPHADGWLRSGRTGLFHAVSLRVCCDPSGFAGGEMTSVSTWQTHTQPAGVNCKYVFGKGFKSNKVQICLTMHSSSAVPELAISTFSSFIQCRLVTLENTLKIKSQISFLW